MPDLTAGCCVNSFIAFGFSDFLFKCLRCAVSLATSAVAFMVVNSSLRVNEPLMDLVNASLISAWFLISFWQLSEYLFNSAFRLSQAFWLRSDLALVANFLAQIIQRMPLPLFPVVPCPLGIESFGWMFSNASSAGASNIFSASMNCDSDAVS